MIRAFIIFFSLLVQFAAATPDDDQLYKLDFGDRLSLSIYGEPDSYREVMVDNRGLITFPVLGEIEVRGKSINHLREELNERIKEFYRYSFVNITPVQFGGQSYVVLGEVKIPGKKLMYGRETVLSALCRAGGFTTGYYRTQLMEFADLEHAFLLRKGDYVPVDFEGLIHGGQLSKDVLLEPGDYLYIPSTTDQEIYVLGEVINPTPLGYIHKITLAQALSMAGGTTIHADSRIVVVRGSLCHPTTYCVCYNSILRGAAPDFPLRPGDIVYVPPCKFTELRELAKFAVRTFVGSVFSRAGNRSWDSIKNANIIDNNVNVIPTTVF